MGYPADLIHDASWSGIRHLVGIGRGGHVGFQRTSLKLTCNDVGDLDIGCGDVCIVLLAI